MTHNFWFEKSYRRSLMDMHIEDWDPSFLSLYEPLNHIELLKTANIQSAMVYAHSHVGCCYWPTKTGHMHKLIQTNGRDILGEIIEGCHRESLDVIVYYSLMFNNRAYDEIPDSRIIDVSGCATREKKGGVTHSGGRYGVCCPNSMEYRSLVEKQLNELLNSYQFEGMFLDMTFWTKICYCKNCARRFYDETGMELPTTIDWKNKTWRLFQLKREQWLAEFGFFATGIIKDHNPGISVAHNSACINHPWPLATSAGLAGASDYMAGDYYGSWLEQSFICKLYESVTTRKPFEYMSSICCPDIKNHTTYKTEDELLLHTILAMAHGGAVILIDAVNPDGTQNPETYETIGRIFKETEKYEKYINGDLVYDVAVYFSITSKYDPDTPPVPVGEYAATGLYPHMEAALGVVDTLKEMHIPFGVVYKDNLLTLPEKAKCLVLPDVAELDSDEITYITQFAESGGGVYISGCPSEELLSKFFNAKIIGKTDESTSYISPIGVTDLMPGISSKYPLFINSRQIKTVMQNGTNVAAKITLPYTNPDDSSKFASIHSNPPGIATEYPAIVKLQYGKGQLIWMSAPIEKIRLHPHKKVFKKLIDVLSGRYSLLSDAPSCVEFVTLHQAAQKRYTISAVNEQERLPPVMVSNAHIKFKASGCQVREVRLLPGNEPIRFEKKPDGYIEFEIGNLSVFKIFSVLYD